MTKELRVIAYYEAEQTVEVPDDFDADVELLGLPEEVTKQLDAANAKLIDLEEAPGDAQL